jgi:catechol 2,3-dioxygenase-like lactoylglutathione lyase family enzyme
MEMDHVSLTARSVDRSIEFYEAIGLKLVRVTRMRRGSGAEYRNAYMFTGRFMLDAAASRLRAIGAPVIGEPFSISRDAVGVTFFDGRASPGFHYIRKPTKKPWRIALFSDPDGVNVELIER